MAVRTIINFTFLSKTMRVVINATHPAGTPKIFIELESLDATEQPAWQDVTHRDKLPQIIALAMSLALRDGIAQPGSPNEIRIGALTPEWGSRSGSP